MNLFKEPRGKLPYRALVPTLAQFVPYDNKLAQCEVKWMKGYLAPGTKETLRTLDFSMHPLNTFITEWQKHE